MADAVALSTATVSGDERSEQVRADADALSDDRLSAAQTAAKGRGSDRRRAELMHCCSATAQTREQQRI
jgi:hypothetical protein